MDDLIDYSKYAKHVRSYYECPHCFTEFDPTGGVPCCPEMRELIMEDLLHEAVVVLRRLGKMAGSQDLPLVEKIADFLGMTE